MNERIILRAGEALVAGGPPNTASEPEVIIGELDGPVGTALATLTGDQVVGHSRVFALLNTDIMVRPVTLCVSKVSVTESKYTSILMGTVQFAIANGVSPLVAVYLQGLMTGTPELREASASALGEVIMVGSETV